ncbi:MAG: PspA/IM30 family protein [Deltaproteobacteria bacterium]|nr:MAG: PspA/IM30 family protein [Deltaproteobacteria bacterium]
MTIKLLDRMTTLLKADAHGVVEALEDRALLIKQVLREAELELLQKRARCEALTDEERRISEETARLHAEARALDEDVALALEQGEEELARFATRRLLTRRKDLAQLELQLREVCEAREALRERLEAQERAFDDMRLRARTRLDALRRLDASGSGLEAPAVADEEVEIELLRRKSEARGRAS